jgi:hypothetical protein
MPPSSVDVLVEDNIEKRSRRNLRKWTQDSSSDEEAEDDGAHARKDTRHGATAVPLGTC